MTLAQFEAYGLAAQRRYRHRQADTAELARAAQHYKSSTFTQLIKRMRK